MKIVMVCLLLLLVPMTALTEQGLLDQARESVTGSLSGMVESQLGVTEDQAEGGIGSMLTLARERLSADEFDEVAGAIPGAENYIEAANDLGALSSPLQSLGDLNEALSRLGIPPETAARFVPVVTDLVGNLGSEDAARLLSSALSG